MSENTAINSDAQQSKTMRISKTIKGEKVKEKKQYIFTLNLFGSFEVRVQIKSI